MIKGELGFGLSREFRKKSGLKGKGKAYPRQRPIPKLAAKTKTHN